MAMADDLRLFDDVRQDLWRKFPNQYALIQDLKLVNVFPSYAEALNAAAAAGYKPGEFLIKQITKSEPIENI